MNRWVPKTTSRRLEEDRGSNKSKWRKKKEKK
jgi:hypothetical protein